MIERNTSIGIEMHRLISRWFTAEPLAKYAIDFVEEKLRDTLSFGELTYIHYHMFDGKGANIDQAVAAVELFILASDILDDLEDGDSPSRTWMKISQSLTLHIATAMITLSQQALLESVSDEALRGRIASMMNEQLLKSANGQMIDLENNISDDESYLYMVEQKSASLIVWACMTGVMLTGHSWNEKVAEYASQLGIASQIRNDTRDLLRWDEKSDFLNRKRTLLTIYLLEGIDEQGQWIADYFSERITESSIQGKEKIFYDICENSGAALYGSVISRMHYNRFEELLLEMNIDDKWKKKLLNMLK